MTDDIYMVGDETTIHVYEGMKCMAIYDRETGTPRFITGFHRLDNQLTTDGADRDGDVILPGEVKFPKVDDETRFRFITEEMVTLYSKKNADYGDAFTQSLDEDGLLVSKIRIKDKLNRFAKLIENDALVNDESMRDTLIDMANYAVMTMMWLDKNE